MSNPPTRKRKGSRLNQPASKRLVSAKDPGKDDIAPRRPVRAKKSTLEKKDVDAWIINQSSSSVKANPLDGIQENPSAPAVGRRNRRVGALPKLKDIGSEATIHANDLTSTLHVQPNPSLVAMDTGANDQQHISPAALTSSAKSGPMEEVLRRSSELNTNSLPGPNNLLEVPSATLGLSNISDLSLPTMSASLSAQALNPLDFPLVIPDDPLNGQDYLSPDFFSIGLDDVGQFFSGDLYLPDDQRANSTNQEFQGYRDNFIQLDSQRLSQVSSQTSIPDSYQVNLPQVRDEGGQDRWVSPNDQRSQPKVSAVEELSDVDAEGDIIDDDFSSRSSVMEEEENAVREDEEKIASGPNLRTAPYGLGSRDKSVQPPSSSSIGNQVAVLPDVPQVQQSASVLGAGGVNSEQLSQALQAIQMLQVFQAQAGLSMPLLNPSILGSLGPLLQGLSLPNGSHGSSSAGQQPDALEGADTLSFGGRTAHAFTMSPTTTLPPGEQSVLADHHQRNRPVRAPSAAKLAKSSSDQSSIKRRTACPQLVANRDTSPTLRQTRSPSVNASGSGTASSSTRYDESVDGRNTNKKKRDDEKADFFPTDWRRFFKILRPKIILQLLEVNPFPEKEAFMLWLKNLLDKEMKKVKLTGGYYEKHLNGILELLWNYVAAYRGELKTLSREYVSWYDHLPTEEEEAKMIDDEEYYDYIATSIDGLINKFALFQENGVDEHDRPNSFQFPAIKELCLAFFYRGDTKIAKICPTHFDKAIPEPAVGLVTTSMACALSELATGELEAVPFTHENFKGTFDNMMTLMDKIADDPYQAIKFTKYRQSIADQGFKKQGKKARVRNVRDIGSSAAV